MAGSKDPVQPVKIPVAAAKPKGAGKSTAAKAAAKASRVEPETRQRSDAAGPVSASAAADPAPIAPKPVSVTAPSPAPDKPVPAAAAPASAAAAPVETLTKGLFAMTDTTAFTAGAEKAQALFSDFNARAKTAAEKSARIVEELTELGKGNVEALVASGKIAAQGAEALGAEAAAYGKSSFEKASGAFKSFTTVKSPVELFQLQSEFAKSSFDAMVAESSKLTESMVKLAGEVMQPLSNRFAVAAEKVKAATL